MREDFNQIFPGDFNMQAEFDFWEICAVISSPRKLEIVQNKKSADLYMRGQAHIDAGRHLEALQCYLKVIKIIPNSWDAGFRCGVLLFELQRYEEALSFLIAAKSSSRAMQPHSTCAPEPCGCCEDFEEAIVLSEQAEALTPDDPDVFNNSGIILHCLCRDTDAVIGSTAPYFLSRNLLMRSSTRRIRSSNCKDLPRLFHAMPRRSPWRQTTRRSTGMLPISRC